MIRAETITEVQQLYSSSHNFQAENSNKAMYIPLPSQMSLPCTLQDLAGSLRKTSSKCRVTEQNTYNLVNWREFLNSRHTATKPSDKGGDTEVRHLRSGSRHYWEKNKATDTTAASPSPAHPTLCGWFQQGHLGQLSTAPGCRGSTGVSGAQNPITHHTFPLGGAWDWSDLVTEGIPTSSGNTSHIPQCPSRDRKNQPEQCKRK